MVKAADNFRQALQLAAKRAKEAAGMRVRVGFHAHQHYPDAAKTPVAYVAAIHEYGAPEQNIPARPFIRPAVQNNGKEWTAQLKKGIAESLVGGRDVATVFDMVGMLASADIQASIAQVTSPPLAQSTIKARNRQYKSASKDGNVSSKPLVDTGLMLASVTHAIVREGEE